MTDEMFETIMNHRQTPTHFMDLPRRALPATVDGSQGTNSL